jgi:tripartite-type tricarboxylate transporter receptor subunit TctC
MRLVTALIGTLLIAAMPAMAQDAFPSRPVRIVMPFPPGSGTDILARLIADQLTGKWGEPVTVDNPTGGGGNIGAAQVARAAPDGYTLLFVPAPVLAINPFMYRNMSYDPAKLAPVSMVSTVALALVVRPDFPANSVKELIDYARANPGKVTFASSSIGSTQQLAAVQVEMMTGVKMVHVPYRGAAPALTDVMASHVDMDFDIVSTTLPLLKAGKIKVLGIGSKTRSPLMPDVPTLDESGLPGYEATTWFGMAAPPDTPPAITGKISADVAAVLKTPQLVTRLHDLGMDIAALDPQQSGKFFADERVHWGNLVKAAGIEPQ